jgi:hypothetical protein
MSFLQPLLLAGLPLVGLPLLIHLINRWRHRTIHWGAMMFLLDAKRMTRGMARLRYWLIMALRMLALAALFLGVARPLLSGWLGSAVGGSSDTAIILLDRSASMEQRDASSRRSKREASLATLAEFLGSFDSNARLVLIESTRNTPQELDSAKSLVDHPDASATATGADIPAMLLAALDYVTNNQTGQTDIWICSDSRASDWRMDDGRWRQIRDGFARFEAVRFHLLAYSRPAGDNLSVRVVSARLRGTGDELELVLDMMFRAEPAPDTPIHPPAHLMMGGSQSALDMELNGEEFLLQGHTVPLSAGTEGGWGKIELPADDNPIDNVCYFVFARPPEHRTTIVAEDTLAAETIRLAAVAPLDPSVTYSAEVQSPSAADQIDWSATSLLIWQAPPPEGFVQERMLEFVRGGRPILFFPPRDAAANPFLGISWREWRQEDATEGLAVSNWRGDSDLLAGTQGGDPLPLGKLRVTRHRQLTGPINPLARLEGGDSLLARVAGDNAPVYFCATLPRSDHSSLAEDGVAFYAMIQRALSIGADSMSNARSVTAGTSAAQAVENWQPADDALKDIPTLLRPFRAGAFRQGEQWAAVDRPASEDGSPILAPADVDRLFEGLNYRRVEQESGDSPPLASEIWRAFLTLMAVALLGEAWLCLPEKRTPTPGMETPTVDVTEAK